MNFDQINRWLTLTANLGVIAGIFLLYLEIQQNNAHLDAQSRASRHEARSNDVNRIFFDDDILYEATTKSANGNELSDRERFVFGRWIHQTFLNWEFTYQEYQRGLASESELNVNAWKQTISTFPYMRTQWEATKEYRYTTEFVLYMESNIVN